MSIDHYRAPDGVAAVLLDGNAAALEPGRHLLAQEEAAQPIAGFMGKAFSMALDPVSHQRAGVTQDSAPLAPVLQVVNQVVQAPLVEPPIPDFHIRPRDFVLLVLEPEGSFFKR